MSQSFWRCQSGSRSWRSEIPGLTTCDAPPHLYVEQSNYTLINFTIIGVGTEILPFVSKDAVI